MLNYFIWNGVNSRELSILCSNPDAVIPRRDMDRVIIPGRSGFMSIDNGAYGLVTKTLECRLFDNRRMESIAKWLDGSGKVIFSDEPDRYYKAVINKAIPIQYMLKRYRAFMLSFDCQPFKYNVSEQNDTLEFTSGILRFRGKGTVDSEPVITVYGNGNITLNVNGKSVGLAGVVGSITLNSEIMECHKDGVNMNNKMTGDFPSLSSDGVENAVSFTGNVSRVEIRPNWRWL